MTAPTAAHLVHVGAARSPRCPAWCAGAGGAFVPPEVTVERVGATSADGTRVPYFLIRAAGARRRRAAADPAVRVRRLQDPGASPTTGRVGRAGSPPAGCWRSPTCAGAASSAPSGTRPAGSPTSSTSSTTSSPSAEHLQGHRRDHAGAAGPARPQQRRPARGGGDDAAARPRRRGAARGRRAGHAALPPLHRRARRGSPTTATRATRTSSPTRWPTRRCTTSGRGPVPGDAGDDRGPRRPGRPAAQPQVHRDPAARPGAATPRC